MSSNSKKPRRLTSSFVKSTLRSTKSSNASTRTTNVRLSHISANREAAQRAKALQLQALTAAARADNSPGDSDEPPFDADRSWDDDEVSFGEGSEIISGWVDGEDPGDAQIQRTEHSRDGPAVDETRHEVFASYHHFISERRRRDQRTRQVRNANMYASWDVQMEDIVAAYLEWRYGLSPSPEGVQDPALGHPAEPSPGAGPPSEPHVFEVTAVDIKDQVRYHRIEQRSNERANVALIRAGLLGCSPINPSVAISLECLELYHQIRRRQSSFSLQAMAKVLCALHNVTYFPTFCTQLSIAFDVYLDLQRRVQVLVNQALHRDTPDWRLLNACPPCGYKLEGEPILQPARLQAMDGNDSLKRIDGAGHTDVRIFSSEYFISPADVDRFKDDVRTRPGARVEGIPQEEEGAPPHGLEETPCTDNWVAANATSKETLRLFEQTGMFVSVCRHGFMQTLVEMRRSGELAKYGLATLNKIIDTFGDDQCMGYDIGCSHKVTVAASSIGHKARIHRLLLAINAFHGHAHNLLCQLRNHPMYIAGLGIEDLETCERVFSSSNAVARVVRYSSYFHWRQFIDLHYRQWDEDKYFELSKFLYNNYRQALAVIREFTPELEHYKELHGFVDGVFESWRTEQLGYLTGLKDEPEADTHKVEYVEGLDKLKQAESIYGSMTTVRFQDYTPADFFPSGALSSADQARDKAREVERRKAYRRLVLAMNVVDDIELRHGILERWTASSPEYQEAAGYLKHRLFIRVVEELERLVVQRLFELAKANLMETGYKMRKHIGKAIARRSRALHTALDKYNIMAPLQEPPRPILDYAAVAAYSWLGEFEMLKESRHDVLHKPWAVPANREFMIKYFRIQRAREELVRLNVEVQRLRTWVDDEHAHIARTVCKLKISNPRMAACVHARLSGREHVNHVHHARIRAIYQLEGYTGSTEAGQREGGMAEDLLPAGVGERVSEDEAAVGVDLRGELRVDVDHDDALRDEALRFSDTMANM